MRRMSMEPADDAALDMSMAVSQLASNGTDLRIMLKLLVGQLAGVLGDRMTVDRAGRFRKSEEIRSVRVVWATTRWRRRSRGHPCAVPSATARAASASAANRWMDMWLTRLLSTLQSEAATSEQAPSPSRTS